MRTSASTLLWSVVDRLYHWKWWSLAALCVVVNFGPLKVRAGGGIQTWTVIAVSIALLWLPISLRWARAIGIAGQSFLDGLENESQSPTQAER